MTNKLTAHLLPTEDASPLWIYENRLEYSTHTTMRKCVENNELVIPQHLYLCSTEPIKEGDLYIDGNNVFRALGKEFTEGRNSIKGLKKILFTTDPKLIADGVGKIDGNTICKVHIVDGYTGINFLTEFCKRYNQKDAKKVICKCGKEMFFSKGIYICPCRKWQPVQKNKGVDVEKLAEKEYPISKGGSMWMPSSEDCNNANKQEGFVKGYNQALQSAGQYSLEDMRNALSEAFKASQEGYQITADEIIQSLQSQSKGDIIIEYNTETQTLIFK